jgi:hypothetical protein
MPGISTTRTTIGLGNRGGVNWATYWATNATFWAKSRSGTALVDDFGNNANILLPYISKTADTYIYYNDGNGYLDIGASNFSIAVWAKSPNATKTARRTICGKATMGTTINGAYFIESDITTGYISATFQSGTSPYTYKITSNIDFTSGAWFFIRLSIDVVNHVGHLYINETEVGAGTAFNGSFATPMDVKWQFLIGAIKNSGGTALSAMYAVDVSDIYIYKKLLSVPEGATLYARGFVTGAKAHWCMTDLNYNDISTNNYHLTGNTAQPTSYILKKYSTGGSRQGLDKGYSLYKKIGGRDIYIPFDDSGSALTTPSVPTGYTKNSDVATHAMHNLADSYIEFAGAEWDRSTAAIYSDHARLAKYSSTAGADTSLMTYYDSTVPKSWHISELNQQKILNTKLATYQAKTLVKFNTDSISNRSYLEEILSTTLDDADLTTALTYTGDASIINSHSLAYRFENENILFHRGNKILKYTAGTAPTNTLYLSVDNGVTFPYSKQVAALATV